MTGPSTQLWHDGLQRNLLTDIPFYFDVAAGAVTQLTGQRYPVLVGTAAGGELAQAKIDALLGSTTEVDASVSFATTAMGTDSVGFVIALDGQCDEVLGVFVEVCGTGARTYIAKTATLPNTLTSGILATSNGNIAGRIILTGLDILTDKIVITPVWRTK